MTTFNTVFLAAKKTTTSPGSTPRLAALIALSVSLLGSVVANADELVGAARTQQVKLADLDLSTADGQQLARARLHEVARTLCSRVADELDLSHQANYVKCIDSTVAQANQRLQAFLNQTSATRLAQADTK